MPGSYLSESRLSLDFEFYLKPQNVIPAAYILDSASITQTNCVMLYKEIIAVYFVNEKKGT